MCVRCVCIILLMPTGRVGDEKVLYARQQVDDAAAEIFIFQLLL